MRFISHRLDKLTIQSKIKVIGRIVLAFVRCTEIDLFNTL